MTVRGRLPLVLVLALSGAVLSGLLLLQHHGEDQAVSAVNAFCGEAGQSGCDEVNRSPYSEVLGVPLAAAGLAFYLALALLLALAWVAGAELLPTAAFLVWVALGLALALDVVLLGVQAFVIKAFCKLCLATYGVTTAGFVLLLPARRHVQEVRPALARPAGRLVASGWLLGTLALVTAVAAGDIILRYREQRRMLLLLGSPSAAPAAPTGAAAPSPAAPGSTEPAAPGDAGKYRDEARQAQEQARKLQEILDDPDKLQQYLTDKASRDYDATPVQNLDVGRAPVQGAPTAPIRLVIFSDFLCPWCRNLAGGLASFLPQSGGRVVVFFKHYPIDQTCNEYAKTTLHPGACWPALGGVCAQDQGRFWPYHDKVFGSPLRNPGRDDILKLAAEIGLDTKAFESCLASPRTGERLLADMREAHRLGVSGTPTVFVNGRMLANLNSFMLAIEKESKRLGLPPLPPPRGN